MLSTEDQRFISQEMKILLDSIDFKVTGHALLPYREQFESAISFFIHSIRAQNKLDYTPSRNSFEDSPAEKEINKYSAELSKTLFEAEAVSVLDSLRHAFCSFAYNGLHQLFTRQENENWYPKVILDEELRPNDINKLPDIVVLYRGTDIAEFNSANYGQSWTTCKRIADAFAFKNYIGQSWFKNSERVVLETKISKKHAYFSDQSGEFEVVIDVRNIGCVKIINSLLDAGES